MMAAMLLWPLLGAMNYSKTLFSEETGRRILFWLRAVALMGECVRLLIHLFLTGNAYTWGLLAVTEVVDLLDVDALDGRWKGEKMNTGTIGSVETMVV